MIINLMNDHFAIEKKSKLTNRHHDSKLNSDHSILHFILILMLDIKYPSNVTDSHISKSIHITSWSKMIDHSIKIGSFDIKSVDIFPGDRIGFIEADINYTSNNINNSERIILVGGSASIVVLIICEETKDIYTVLVKQPRIGSGGLQYEFPAGLADDSTDFRMTAVRELEEECGIIVDKESIVNLSELINGSDEKYFTHAHNFYEEVSFYLAVKTMKMSEIKGLDGRYGGVDEEEQITNHIFLFDDILNFSEDPATISIMFLIKKLIKKGKIQLS